ncbi:hypothetical protein O988_05878 [Pseudogymnoascus sp. VKM F-3808]|nr:hypothetical protein O988_05878 [Pseudogymnoascus sp. VKM F-3808]
MAAQLNNEVDSQSKKNTLPLHQAIKMSDRSEVVRLLAENTFLEAKDGQGRTALHLAALLGVEELVQLLLKADANTKAKDCEDMTPLDYASWYLHQGVVQLLDIEVEEYQARSITALESFYFFWI